jgi:RNA polymerase sigma-32 factor
MRQYSMVRIGTTQNQRKLFYKLQKEREALAQLGQEPTNALLAGRLGVTEEEVETMSQRLASRDISLNQPLNGENSTASLLDMEADSSPAIDDSLGLSEELTLLRENIEKIRSQLNEKEKFILEKRLLADEPLTLQEIGDHYGTTREAVRQLENRLIGKIRAALTVSLGGASSRITSDDPKDS